MYDFPDTEPEEYSFDLLEVGYYTAIVDEFDETTTKSSARMITNTYKVTGKIENGEIEQCQNKLIWHNIVFPTEYEIHDEPEKAAFMFELIRKFLKTIGDRYKGQIIIDPRRWINKELAIKIKHDEWAGEMREKVHYVLTIEKALQITTKQSRVENNKNSRITKSTNCESDVIRQNNEIPFLS